MTDRSPSPPTRRVIDVVEMLSAADRPMAIGEIAAALDIARATATAVVRELVDASWITRDADRCYAVGPALAGIGARVRGLPDAVTARLAALAGEVACGVTLSRIDIGAMTVVAKAQGGVRDIPGMPLGQRVPLAYPAGASVMPWRTSTERDRWLSTVDPDDRRGADTLLAGARDRRHIIFRPESADAGLVDVLADLLDVVGGDLLRPRLRNKVLGQLANLTARAYTDDELAADVALPVSYLAAPVLIDDRALYELQMGPLRSAVTRTERADYVAALSTTAIDLATAGMMGAGMMSDGQV